MNKRYTVTIEFTCEAPDDDAAYRAFDGWVARLDPDDLIDGEVADVQYEGTTVRRERR